MGIVVVARFARLGGRRSQAGDHIHLEPDELGGKLREPSVALASVADFEREVLAFDPAGRSQSLAEHLDARGEVLLGAGRKDADAGRPRRGLSADDARVDERGERDQDEPAAAKGSQHIVPSRILRRMAPAR